MKTLIVAWLVLSVLLGAAYTLSVFLLDAWAERAERQQDEERARLDRILQASHPLYPAGPKGGAWRQGRRESR